jgi:hypothetical protein
MSTKYIVNNVSGQTINGESVLRPYKVYTALLTQSGGDNPVSINIPESLVIGQSYQISLYSVGDDFTNVGAPSNTQDTWFVATGTTPAIWTNGSNLFNNSGAPVVTVLENTIGNIYWTYSQEGNYQGNLNSTFFLNKTYYSVNNRFSDDGGASAYDAFIIRGTDDYFVLNTFFGGIYSNSLISSTNPLSIEIRVYN